MTQCDYLAVFFALLGGAAVFAFVTAGIYYTVLLRKENK